MKKEEQKYKILTDKLDEQSIKYFTIEIESEYICFLRKPTKNILSKVVSLMQVDKISALYLLLTDCWLGGDEEIKEDSDLFLSVISTVDQILENYPVEFVLEDNKYKVIIDNKSCIIRKPRIAELSSLFNTMEKDSVSAIGLLLNTCWVEGDEDIKTNDDYILSLMPLLEKVVSVRSATLKKN